MAKTAQKKKQTVASPPYVSTQAKNTNAHPGLVDISEDSDPERANHNSKRKAARSKGEIAKQYAQEVIFEDVDVEMSYHDGGADNEKAGAEGPQSSSEMVVAEFEMEAEKTLEDIEVPAAAVVPGGPLRRFNAVFFGRNSQGNIVVLDQSPIKSRVVLKLLAMNPDQSRKHKAVVHKEDPPAEPPSGGKALRKLEQAAKPIV
ncbi:hypothetical protein EW026_g7420 [Hermanssonia centrifuga]|uniref:Uncharacterized protein n=1 Tax=Hermanssonia centrifuga TaxID=98765 RepID=A0A4S4K7V5_9APHY|nr:hypothetical protein EW026_g7420 [Hermanssonia centrifuga]